MSKTKKPIPFDFVLELLGDLSPTTKPMFGCTAVYVKEKIVLILRKKSDGDVDNGVWLATTQEHHEELRRHFPSMRSIHIFGPGVTGWQILPEDAEDFEASVEKACELILKGNPLIGKIPKGRSLRKRKGHVAHKSNTRPARKPKARKSPANPKKSKKKGG